MKQKLAEPTSLYFILSKGIRFRVLGLNNSRLGARNTIPGRSKISIYFVKQQHKESV